MKARVNLSISETVTEEARSLGLNLSRVAEDALRDAIRTERNRQWREDNRAALDAYADQVETEGLPLAHLRSF